MECAFGILTGKWRILHRPIDLHIETAIEVIKACTVLHNFVRDKEGINFDNQSSPLGEASEERRRPTGSSRGGPSANAIRTAFADYFVSDIGSIPWQAAAI